MADIRIKDLTTTASSTASDDFIAVDGATNGTRKLNAYSPSFGGNATVVGTLTVNGTSGHTFAGPLIGQGTTFTGYQFLAKDTGSTAVGAAYALQTSGGTDKWRWGLRGPAGSLTDSLIFSYFNGSWSEALTLSNTGVVSVPSTTASTSTSTGALVVSGGVGVAGAIYAGNAINATVNGSASIIGRNGSASSFTSVSAYSGASDEIKGTLTSSTAGVIIVGSQTNHPLAVYVNNAEVARWDTSANFQTRVTGTAPSLATNSTMTFELTSNTSLKIFVRGSDGTTRSTTLTLA